MVDAPHLRYFRALGGVVPLGRHGPGSVFIDNKNTFHYICMCGHETHSITDMFEHQSPSHEIMDEAQRLLARVVSYEEWMRGINEDKYILPPFINWLHRDRPSIARK